MLYPIFAALMRDLADTDDQAAVIQQYAQRADDPQWAGLLRSVVRGDVDLLQRALALGDTHPITRVAQQWLAEVGSDRPYFRLMNRYPGAGPRLPRVTFPKFARDAVATNGDIVVTIEQNTIAVYSADGTLRKKFKARYPWDFDTIAIHPDGRRIVIGHASDDNRILVYDWEKGKRVASFGDGAPEPLNFVLLPDGRHVLGGIHELTLWALDSPKSKPIWSAEDKSYFDIALHPNGKWCVSRRATELNVRSLTDGSLVRRVSLDTEYPDPYDVSTDRPVLCLPDGARVLVALYEVIEVHDLDSGALVDSLTGHTDTINAMAIAPGGKTFASAGDDGYVRVWDVQTLRCVWSQRAHQNGVNGVAFFGDDAVVSVGGDGVARLWDVDPGEVSPATTDTADSVRHAVAVGGSVYALHNDGVLREWETATGQCVRSLHLPEPDLVRERLRQHHRLGDGIVRSWYWSEQNSLLLAVRGGVYRCDLESGECHQFYASTADYTRKIGPVSGGMWYVNEEPGGLSRFRIDSSLTVDVASHEPIEDYVSYDVVGDRWLVKKYSTRIDVLDLTEEPPRFRRIHQDSAQTFRAVAGHRNSLFAGVTSEAAVCVFQLPDGRLVGEFGKHEQPVVIDRPIAFSADGTMVYSTYSLGRLLETTIASGETRSWLMSKKEVRWLEVTSPNTVAFVAQDSVGLVDLDADGLALHWPIENARPVATSGDVWVLLFEGGLVFLKAVTPAR